MIYVVRANELKIDVKLIGWCTAPDLHGLMVSDKSQNNELFFRTRNENCDEDVKSTCINYYKHGVGNEKLPKTSRLSYLHFNSSVFLHVQRRLFGPMMK